MKSTLPAWLPNAFVVVVLGIAAVNYFAPFADLDWTWQVRTGELIVRDRTLQPPDHFSYTIQGNDLPDFEWLYEAVLYLTWNTFGIGGLKFLRVMLVLTPIAIVLRRLAREGVPWHGQMLVLFACIFVLSPVWNLRPLYCTTIGLLLVSGWLHDHCTGRQPVPWYLPIATLIWANSHPGVVAGQGLLVGAIAWEWINRLVKINKPLERAALHRLTFIAGLGLAATCIGPDPIERFRYAFKPELAHPIHRTFSEMQPTWTTLGSAPFNFVPIYLVAAMFLFTVAFRFRRYRLWELAFIGVLTLLGNFAVRGAMDWFLNMLALGVPHLCVMWRHALEDPKRVRRGMKLDNRIKRLFAGVLFQPRWGWVAAGLAALLIVSVIPPLSREMPRRDSDEWPVAALDYLESAEKRGNFFGPPDYSTYVNWRLKENARGYTDTRGFFFPPVLLEDSEYLPRMAAGWEDRMNRVLNEFKTEYLFLETTGARGQLWRSLQPHVGEPVFLNDQSVVLSADQVRRAVPAIGGQVACK